MISNKMNDTNEYEIIHEIQLDASHFNANLCLKPQSYQMLYCELVEKHLALYDLNAAKTIANGVAWVILSLTIDVKKPIRETSTVYARTWKSGLKGPYFMRDFILEDEEGNVYFQGTSFSVLLDLQTRRVCRDKSLPYYSLASYDLHTTKGFPSWKSAYGGTLSQTKGFQKVGQVRKVENSFIDMLGHVNNIRYGEFIYDAMENDQIDAMEKLSRMEIYFGSELKLGDTFTVSTTVDEHRLYVCGENVAAAETSFHAVLEFNTSL